MSYYLFNIQINLDVQMDSQSPSYNSVAHLPLIPSPRSREVPLSIFPVNFISN